MAEGKGAAGFGGRSLWHRAEWWGFAGIALFVAGFAALGIFAETDALLRHFAALDLALVAALLALSCGNYLLRGLRWQMFSHRVEVRLPLARSLLYYVAGFALTVTPGKLGEAFRLWLLRRGHGHRYERTAGLLVADRLSDAVSLLLLCLLGISTFADRLPVLLLLGALLVAVSLAVLRPAWLLPLIGAAYGLHGRRARLFARLRTAVRQLARLGSWRLHGLGLGLGLLGWLAEAGALALLLDAFGSALPLATAAFIFAFSMLVGAAAMVPGGLGGTEAGMIALLVAVDVDFDTAVAATFVIRATTLWFAVVLGFAVLPLALRAVRRGDTETASA